MKKILLLLLLLAPFCANAQYWFTANAVRFDVNEEWETCDVPVSIDNDWKINIYADSHHTIRKIKDLGNMVDEDGNKHNLWEGVHNTGEECTIALTIFKHIPYMRLSINYGDFEVYYMLSEDE